MKSLYLALALVLVTAGCASRSIYVEPNNRADRMLYYYEQDRQGTEHAISSIDLSSKETERVPSPALIDIDSQLRINVRPPPAAPGGELIGTEQGVQLSKDKARIVKLMNLLEKYLEASEKAVEAYITQGADAADTLIKAQAASLDQFRVKFLERYPPPKKEEDRANPAKAVEYRAANKLIGKSGGLVALRPFLQAELDSIQARDDAIQEAVKARSSTLKIEAFLDSTGGGTVALHVRGYDNLDKQSLASRDRAGLNLGESERVELAKQIKATEDVARALEQVRVKEISFYEGIKETLRTAAPELAAKVEEADKLADKLKDPERLMELRQAFQQAVDRARDDTSAHAKRLQGKVNNLAEPLRDSNAKLSRDVQSLLLIVADAKALGDRWKELDPGQGVGEVTAIILASKSLADRLEQQANAISKELVLAGNDANELLKLKVAGFSDEVLNDFYGYLEDSSELGDAKQKVRAYQTDLIRAKELGKEVVYMLNAGKDHVERLGLKTPEAFDVDIADLQNTSIDLRRVASRDGDTVFVRATIKEPGRKPVESEADFEITHFGWHARLSPSVVLVRPEELASGNEEFRFAPALGWMHHYRPRPEDSTWYANLARPLQPAVGLHTTFLNFDNESGIGIGGTLSFWNDRLQVGIGYNLSAGSSDEGRVYYFIGSDLIGLLQTVGVGGTP